TDSVVERYAGKHFDAKRLEVTIKEHRKRAGRVIVILEQDGRDARLRCIANFIEMIELALDHRRSAMYVLVDRAGEQRVDLIVLVLSCHFITPADAIMKSATPAECGVWPGSTEDDQTEDAALELSARSPAQTAHSRSCERCRRETPPGCS